MKKLLAISLILLGFAAAPARAGVFTQEEMDEISCAALKMQLFYYYLAPERDEKVTNYTM